MKKILFFIISLIVFIPIVSAESKTVEKTDCENGKCTLTTEDFELEIKGFALYDMDDNKISDLTSWTLNPIYEEIAPATNQTFNQLKLNVNFDDIESIISEDSFMGNIKIDYKITYSNLLEYSYFVSNMDELFVLVFAPSSARLTSSEKEGQSSYYFVNKQPGQALTITSDYEIEDEDSTASGTHMLFLWSLDAELTTNMPDTTSIMVFVISDTNFEDGEVDSEDIINNFNSGNNSNNDSSDSKTKQENTASNKQQENKGVANSKTGILDYSIIFILLIVSIIIFKYSSKNFFRRKI